MTAPPPTHLQDANSVGTRLAVFEAGFQRDNPKSLAAQARLSLLLSFHAERK